MAFTYKDLQKRCMELKKQGLHDKPCAGLKEHLTSLVQSVEMPLTLPKDYNAPLRPYKVYHRTLDYYGKEEKLLGEGYAGKVYRYSGGSYGKPVAIKVIFPLRGLGIIEPQAIVEISALNMVDHPNVMHLIDVVDNSEGVLSIVMPLAEHGTLEDMKYDLLKLEIKQLLYDTTCGIAYLHRHGIAHGDIKPLNVLVFNNTKNDNGRRFVARVSDLGSITAEACVEKPEPRPATPWTLQFRAPEAFLGLPYTYAADIWSLGAVFYEMYTQFAFLEFSVSKKTTDHMHYLTEILDRLGKPRGVPTFFDKAEKRLNRENDKDTVRYMRKFALENRAHSIRYVYPVDDADLAETLETIFQYEPTDRPSAYDVLQSHYFDEVRDVSREVKLVRCVDVLREYIPYPSLPYTDTATLQVLNVYAEWLLNLMIRLETNIGTLELAVRLMDEFLYRDVPSRPQDELIVVAALGLASSVREPGFISMEMLLQRVGNNYDDKTIIAAQKSILRAVKYNVHFPIEQDFRDIAVSSGGERSDLDALIAVALVTSEARFTLQPSDIAALATRARKSLNNEAVLTPEEVHWLNSVTTVELLDELADDLGQSRYSAVMLRFRSMNE